MRVRGSGCAGLLCAVAVLASGCAGSPASGPSGSAGASEPGSAPEVVTEIVQLRGDVASGHIELRVTNESDAPITIVRATYASSAWREPMVREGEAEIPAGARRNLRLLLPDPTCSTSPLEHRATLELADGTVLEQVPQDPLGQLGRIDDPVCDLARFQAEVAALRWLDPVIPADGAGTAVVRLEVSPVREAGERRGTIDAVGATVLLTPVDASGARIALQPVALEVAPGDAPTVIEVPLEPGRCDLHAIAEDKQGTVFRLHATIDGERIELVMVSPDAQRDALLGWAVARCAGRP